MDSTSWLQAEMPYRGQIQYNNFGFSFISRITVQCLQVTGGQCCLRVAAGPCLPDGPIMQLSPYFTRNPCTYWRAIPLSYEYQSLDISMHNSRKSRRRFQAKIKAKFCSTECGPCSTTGGGGSSAPPSGPVGRFVARGRPILPRDATKRAYELRAEGFPRVGRYHRGTRAQIQY